jgi:hypothetical protein
MSEQAAKQPQDIRGSKRSHPDYKLGTFLFMQLAPFVGRVSSARVEWGLGDSGLLDSDLVTLS